MPTEIRLAPWLLLASLTATCEATKDLFAKRSLQQLSATRLAALLSLLTTLLLLPIVLWQGIPAIGPNFWWSCLLGSSLNLVAFWLYARALQMGELSLVAPIVNLTPLFLLLTSPLIVAEHLAWQGSAGVILLVIGAYQLNRRDRDSSSRLQPLIDLWQQPAQRIMVVVAFLWSITSNLDKIGVQSSDPYFWLLCLFGSTGIVLLILGRGLGPVRKYPWRSLSAMAIFNSVGVVAQMVALNQATVVQIISVKRLSTLIGVVYGAVFFGEKQLRQRFLGAALMMAGAIVLL
ncbi:hypothetical protein syc0322_c [Synechococcus elongatus PCC 6301]|uniref:EamA domain-containing protein n=1 Tax=Synechococcus sp. (strain ATCC 27144 / PCC 6301 / SAUG 1402/1) TaxID=269084 RepID=A0A0H3K5T0_SYNP6|nr:DMT family transporter [Synechococcus elongatus]BAD78512.1 hypothetical protein syc0322_c [Synechococcus elongatus PCC 6301]